MIISSTTKTRYTTTESGDIAAILYEAVKEANNNICVNIFLALRLQQIQEVMEISEANSSIMSFGNNEYSQEVIKINYPSHCEVVVKFKTEHSVTMRIKLDATYKYGDNLQIELTIEKEPTMGEVSDKVKKIVNKIIEKM